MTELKEQTPKLMQQDLCAIFKETGTTVRVQFALIVIQAIHLHHLQELVSAGIAMELTKYENYGQQNVK